MRTGAALGISTDGFETLRDFQKVLQSLELTCQRHSNSSYNFVIAKISSTSINFSLFS